jgi:hypothetical protein
LYLRAWHDYQTEVIVIVPSVLFFGPISLFRVNLQRNSRHRDFSDLTVFSDVVEAEVIVNTSDPGVDIFTCYLIWGARHRSKLWRFLCTSRKQQSFDQCSDPQIPWRVSEVVNTWITNIEDNFHFNHTAKRSQGCQSLHVTSPRRYQRLPLAVVGAYRCPTRMDETRSFESNRRGAFIPI